MEPNADLYQRAREHAGELGLNIHWHAVGVYYDDSVDRPIIREEESPDAAGTPADYLYQIRMPHDTSDPEAFVERFIERIAAKQAERSAP